MGREAQCRVRFGGESGAGQALLETNEILFRVMKAPPSGTAIRP